MKWHLAGGLQEWLLYRVKITNSDLLHGTQFFRNPTRLSALLWHTQFQRIGKILILLAYECLTWPEHTFWRLNWLQTHNFPPSVFSLNFYFWIFRNLTYCHFFIIIYKPKFLQSPWFNSWSFVYWIYITDC